MSLWDYERGPVLMRIEGERIADVYDLTRERSAQVASSRVRSREVAALIEAGTREEGAIGLALQRVASNGRLLQRSEISAVPVADRACVESSLLAGGNGGYLIAWGEGCSTERTIYTLMLED